MTRFQKQPAAHKSPHYAVGRLANSLCILLLAALTALLSSCGSSGSNSEQSGPLAGNWQFTMAPGGGSSFTGSPLQGGFLQQQSGSVTGQIVFSFVTLSGVCNSGAVTFTGTVSGQTVSLAANLNTLDKNGNPTVQTMTLSGGQLGTDGSGNPTIQAGANNNYSFSTDGYGSVNGVLVACGLMADTGTWTATSYPALTGAIQGFFHSLTGGAGLGGQDFPVGGNLAQGPNIGASYASVNGTLVFKDPATLLNDYPCLTTASVTGVISGSNVSLQIYGSTGLVVGQIGNGGPPPFSSLQISPVTVGNSSSGGLMLQGQLGYALTTKSCPSGSGVFGDAGNICLAFGTSTGCTQPITLAPLSTFFLPQVLGSTPAQQTITIANITSAPLANVSIQLTENDSLLFYRQGGGDFNGLPSFTVLQTGQANDCTTLAPLGSTFTLASSCQVTVQFAPQESCPWLPSPPINIAAGSTPPFVEKPSLCPNPLTANLVVTVPNSATADSDGTFSSPISGTGLSAIVPSTGELDFSSETPGETSLPQILTFTNQSPNAVQLLPGANTCNNLNQQSLPYPLTIGSAVAGFQIDRTGFPQTPNPKEDADIEPEPNAIPPAVTYACDFDAGTKVSNFQIAPAPASTCLAAGTGVILQPQQSCTLQIAFAPQPEAWSVLAPNGPGLDYFLAFNTVQCSSGDSNCEIDSGRFPVELKTNPPSPLRLLPNAGLEFGTLIEGTLSSPLTITLFNDPVDANSATVTITSKILSGSDYLELDNCPSSMAPNDSCPLTFTFLPKVIGFDYGTFIITYNTPTQIGLVQTIFLRGAGEVQPTFLRGAGK